jgi:hypothetical protein
VGGRLAAFAKEWKGITKDKFILNIIKNGYAIEFSSTPPVSNFQPTLTLPHPEINQETMLTEIRKLVEKGAVEEVPTQQRGKGFYSNLFLVTKKSGGFRPVLNLKKLNQHVTDRPFRMETFRSVLRTVRPHEWVASLDLSDAYFHVPVNAGSRQYLRFQFAGKHYQFKVLVFGLKSASMLI